jgi:hypothetical protein
MFGGKIVEIPGGAAIPGKKIQSVRLDRWSLAGVIPGSA